MLVSYYYIIIVISSPSYGPSMAITLRYKLVGVFNILLIYLPISNMPIR